MTCAPSLLSISLQVMLLNIPLLFSLEGDFDCARNFTLLLTLLLFVLLRKLGKTPQAHHF